MLSIQYIDDYFVCCSPLSDNTYNLRLVMELFTAQLPHQIRTTRVHQFEQYLSRQELVNYWQCLSGDRTFSFHSSELLKEWALLPSRSRSLYSLKDNLVPVIPPSQNLMIKGYSPPDPICQVLEDIGIPFLDITIVGGTTLSCPHLNDHKTILKALFHLNQEKNLSTVLNQNRVGIILTYLSNIDFRNDYTSLGYAKALPLFKCIDGNFTSLEGKTAYVWPRGTSTVAYVKWACCYPKVVFLCGVSAWTSLGSAEQLHIGTLSAEEVYYNYIFKAFSNLDENERYQHLTHIKDHMFTMNNYYRKSKHNNDTKVRATRFIRGLEVLPCLGEDGGQLRPVSDYCNHKLDIFTTFKRHFRFLPDFFISSETTWKEWLEFFKEIGLRQTVSKEEFLEFCNETASGHHETPVRASQVLLRHLISDSVKEMGWHSDHNFLRQVAVIAFVPTEHLNELSWIRQVPAPSNSLITDGKYLHLANLGEAGVSEASVELWTVKPIVKLPGFYHDIYPEHLALLNSMGVTCKPKVTDVIRNIRNICTLDKFTSFDLFDQYPDKNLPPPGSKGLMEVMLVLIQFLQSKLENLTEGDKADLRDLPFVPVYSTAAKTHRSQVVLVKPTCVLNCAVPDYHPFLHRLPYELNSVISFLQVIGVKSSINLSHIQLVLETAYKSSAGQEFNTITRTCVFTALKDLIHLLSISHHDSKAVSTKDHFTRIAKALTPLYLPNKDKKLALSTNLLYVDSPTFKGKLKLKLEGTRYSMLHIQSTHPLILMYERDFCHLLPREIRPRGLSEMCTQTILDECKCVKDSDVAVSLKATLEMKAMLPKAVAACVRHFTKNDSFSESIEAGILVFLNNFDVITLNHLRMAITFKETDELLANLDTRLFLKEFDSEQDSPPSRCLYLDSKLDKRLHFNAVVGTLSRQLLSLVQKCIPISTETYHQLEKTFSAILVAQNPDEVRRILEESEIPLGAKSMDDLSLKLGSVFPECWHHRLDQTIENVFHPGEIVGYEDMEDHIIVACIMHPVLPEGVESFDSVPRMSMRYQILTSTDDEEGIEVSVLNLYKFLKGLKTEKHIDEEERGLVPYEGETEPVRLQQELRREDIEDIKKKLLKQLDEVWKLPPDERDRAIRRLYLKWHPDKNPDNPDVAEEIFKCLNSEIDRRKSGRIYRDDLDRAARRQRDNLYRERYSFRSNRSRGSPGGNFGRDESPNGGFGSTGWGGPSPGVPPFDEENLRPEVKPEEGRRWVKQAEANFETLILVHSESQNNPKVCADVCFMAHQVAEKALKGGKYFVCGLDENALKSHNLSTHAYGLHGERPGDTHGLVAHTTPLEQYYLEPRYPNRWPFPMVPADQYTYQQADEAKSHAEVILNIIKAIVE